MGYSTTTLKIKFEKKWEAKVRFVALSKSMDALHIIFSLYSQVSDKRIQKGIIIFIS